MPQELFRWIPAPRLLKAAVQVSNPSVSIGAPNRDVQPNRLPGCLGRLPYWRTESRKGPQGLFIARMQEFYESSKRGNPNCRVG